MIPGNLHQLDSLINDTCFRDGKVQVTVALFDEPERLRIEVFLANR